jgi:3-deoxy-D-manno-octulosonic-acid transferase
MFFYSFLVGLVLLAGAPYWLLRMAINGRYRAGIGNRLGFVKPALRERIAALRVERRGGGGRRPLMWIHAVSVGEVLVAARLIDEFRSGEFQKLQPGMVFAISTTTETGQKLAQERLPGCAVFYFPLDTRFAVNRYLNLLEPAMVILMESELWPLLIHQCWRRKIPVAVANARISDRSFPGYMRLRPLWCRVLAKIAIFLAQSEETADRLRKIGAPRIEITGNIKYDTRTAPETPLVMALRSRLPNDFVVVAAGSTVEGEDAIVLDGWQAVLKAHPRSILVLAPRHPERFEAVAKLVESRGVPIVRASDFLVVRAPIKPGSVFLLDTIGDLATMYSLAAVAFVGGSLVPSGGHNPLEPAHFGVPVLMGESFENFREIVESMQTRDGIRIVNRAGLAPAFLEMLNDREAARAMGERGREVSAAQSGATARTSAAILKLLPVRLPVRAMPER